MTAYTEELTSQITVSENQEKSGNNIKMELSDIVSTADTLDSVYKIIRKGDIAFCRSDIY